MKVRFSQIHQGEKSTHHQPETLFGECQHPPRVGYRFTMYIGSNIEGHYTELSTSPVIEILPEGKFRTRSGSMYRVREVHLDWN